MSKKLKKSNLFSKDLGPLLYSYGDVSKPLQSTIECLDEIVTQYLIDICANAIKVSQNSQRNKVKLDDFKFVLRHDPIKLARAEELITTNKIIIEAKRQFNEIDNSLKKYKKNNILDNNIN